MRVSPAHPHTAPEGVLGGHRHHALNRAENGAVHDDGALRLPLHWGLVLKLEANRKLEVWHMTHDDGDREDLEKYEVVAAIAEEGRR